MEKDFDKELFFSLCKKYNVEFESIDYPVIKDKNGNYQRITKENIKNIFEVIK